MTKKKDGQQGEQKFVDLENQLKRALADYANLQKRFDEEKTRVAKFANSLLIAKFLDVLDGLEATTAAHPSEGLELVVKKFRDVLKSENVEEVNSEGQNFDPQLHEGLGVVPGEKDGLVAEVLQKGYTLEGRLLRPARVKVTQKEGN